jgi:hypothetical protein
LRTSARRWLAISQRRKGKVQQAAWVALALSLAVGVPVAVAEVTGTHQVNRYWHGIVGTQPYSAQIEDRYNESNALYCGTVEAGMYHHRPDGGWNTQNHYYNDCARAIYGAYADAGNYPCAKYAWTQGHNPFYALGWHGMRSNQCIGIPEY